MAAAKCRCCQKKLTTNNAYKTTINNKSAYFCNEEHYKQFVKQAESEKQTKERGKLLHNKVCKLFAEVLSVSGITNTVLYKEKAELNKVYSDEIIISYLEENKEWITKSVDRLSGGEYGKIRYVSTILKNKLGDYRPKTAATSPVYTGYSADEHYETKFKLKPRKALLEIEEDCYE